MALEKLKILVETGTNQFNKEIVVLFNPNKISIQKSTNWKTKPAMERDTPKLQFAHGNSATLSMELFFDTFESQIDVRKHTKEIFNLTTVAGHGDKHRPPVCKLEWGETGTFFKGVLQSLSQRFTLFLASGLPVQATLGCSFKEWISDEEEAKQQNKKSTDVVKVRTIKLGDTLPAIAGEEYLDPTLWRPIANANQIINPRILEPGSILKIPKLRP